MKLKKSWSDKKGINTAYIWIFEQDDREIQVIRDNGVAKPSICISNGQGCGSLWYPTITIAKKEVQRLFDIKEEIVTGRNAGLCKECSCSYSYNHKKPSPYPEFVCSTWKKEYVEKVSV